MRTDDRKLWVLLFVIFLIFACTSLGIITYLPEYELISGFQGIFETFTTTAVIVTILIGSLVGLTFVIAFLLSVGYAHEIWRGAKAEASKREAMAVTAAAEALKSQREAELAITVAPPGHQVIAHEVAGKLSISHTPLQLTPGRVNGVPMEFSNEEAQRWLLHTLSHATSRQSGTLREASGQRQSLPLLEAPLPESVDLAYYVPGTPALRKLFLGIGRWPDGQVRPVTAPLDRLVHIATGGSSGFGKSTFMVALAWQVINAHEQPRPVMLDPQGVTFTPFEDNNQLLYPLASDPEDILAILNALLSEMERRQKLFAHWRGIATLAQYNKVVEPGEQLPAIPVFFDEFGLVSDHKDITRHTKKLTQAGRKVGISLIAGAQTWGADEIATALRANLSTSVQFFARDKHQSRILLGTGNAAEITRPGQAFAILPGQPGLIEIQAPDPSTVVEVTPTRIEAIDQPAMPDMPDPEPDSTEARILEMAAAGASYNAIAREIYQSTGGKQTQMIKDTLSKYQQ